MGITNLKTAKDYLTSGQAGEDDTPRAKYVLNEHFSQNEVFSFVAKSLLCVGLLFAFSRAVLCFALPSWIIALAWLILAVFISLGVAYASVIRKTHRQVKYQPGGQLERLNRGRFCCLLIAYLLAAFFAMSLIMEVPKWEVPEWALALGSIPLFLCVTAVVRRRINRNYKPPFRTWGIVCWGSVITALILCAIFVIVLIFTISTSGISYDSALQAFLDAKAQAPYKKTDSILLQTIGQLTAFADGLTQYAITEVSIEYSFVGVIWKLVLGASTFFAIANLLGICWMKKDEIKRIFQPLEDLTVREKQAQKPMKCCYLCCIPLFVLALGGLFLFEDYQASYISNNRFVVEIQNGIQDQLSKTVCIINDKYYDRQAVLKVIGEKEDEAKEIKSQAKDSLVPLINESFDKRIDNIDDYLNWFYSFESYEQRSFSLTPLLNEDYAELMFTEHIESGVDDSKLQEELIYYSERAEAIQPQLMNQLQDMELKLDKESEWMLDKSQPIDPRILNAPHDELEKLILAKNSAEIVRISVAFPEPDLFMMVPVFSQSYKEKIDAAINAERNDYLAIVDGK